MVVKGVTEHVFSNWAETYRCRPELFFLPRSVEDIRDILKAANSNNKKVKVVGSGLSPSDLACTDDYMISMQYCNEVLDVDVDNCTVTIQAGCTLAYLNEEVLPYHGMGFSNLASISEQTVGGMVATASHGSGAGFGSFSSFVIRASLITADGNIIECSRNENLEIFRAVCCNVGVLGILLNSTLQCEPSFNLHQTQHPSSFDDLLTNVEEHISSAEHFRFIWFPHTDHTVAIKSNRTKRKVTHKSNWFRSQLVGFYLLELCLWISTFLPCLVPFINKWFYKACFSQSLERVDRSDKVFNINCLFKQHVTEWAVPRNHTATVLTAMKRYLDENPMVKAHFPVEVRFVKKDNIMFSPSGDDDVTYIGIISYRPYGKDVDRSRWWRFFESLVMQYNGKPHWAKKHQASQAYLKTTYREYESFMQIRQKLDPNGIFINEYWQRILFEN